MVRPQLRERGHELERAYRALTGAAATGVGRVLVVTGEPGIGKTALLDAVRQDALALGFAVGSGKADEVNQITPGAPVLLPCVTAASRCSTRAASVASPRSTTSRCGWSTRWPSSWRYEPSKGRCSSSSTTSSGPTS